MPVGGPVIVVEGERLGVAHPALQRDCKLVLQPLGDVDESRRAGAAVQIFVAAADGEVAAGAIEIELDRAGAVRQVPHGQRASRMRRVVDCPHVVDRGRAVIDMGQGDDRGVVVDRARSLRPARRPSASGRACRRALARHRGRSGNCACWVTIVVRPGRALHRRGEQLEQAHAGRVRDQQLVRLARRQSAPAWPRSASASRSSHACSSWR